MSGGVDSSVTAALLLEQGYDVTGAYMINYEENSTKSGLQNMAESCWVPDYRDALRVAAKLRIPLLKLDFRKEYKTYVLDYMFDEYRQGRTPNPDVMCNKYIKFGFWLEQAQARGFDYLATGHYANIRIFNNTNIENTNYELLQAVDTDKDQTYFLHQLNQSQLAHIMFPLGGLLKSEVRRLAEEFNLPTAQKEESMGICFVGEVPMKDFLSKEIKHISGNIIYSQTKEICGQHDGLAFYTIGQRHIGNIKNQKCIDSVKDSKPLYVVAKNFETNDLIIGHEDDPLLYQTDINIFDMHWIAGQVPVFPLQCEVRFRHRQVLQLATIDIDKTSQHSVIHCNNPQRAITSGQFAVVYKDGVCLGGGVIM